jgi:hypothetical protein
LVEVLVAAGVLAALVGLLLPAVQRVRAAAARAVTVNHLRQVGLGLNHYLATHDERLPGQRTLDRISPGDTLMLDELRPYITDPATARWGFRDPYDPSFAAVPAGDRAVGYADASYAANALLFTGRGRLTAAVRDGTSQTAAFTEHYAYCGQYPSPAGEVTPRWLTSFSSHLAGFSLSGGESVIARMGYYPMERPATFADRRVWDVTPGSRLAAVLPPFQAAPHPLTGGCDPRIPQTPHAVLTLAMADGSARAVRPGVDPAVFWSAVTPAGGETVALD